MKRSSLRKFWEIFKRRVSMLVIISMIITSLSPATSVFATSHFTNDKYLFANEIEVEEDKVDDEMFYVPHNLFEVTEGDENNKFVFKVKRKGEGIEVAKVKLTMVDVSAKYDRDYSIRVIDKAFFSENVQNKSASNNIEEFVKKQNKGEYNYSDAIIDGSAISDDVTGEEETTQYELTEDDKKQIAKGIEDISESIGIPGKLEWIDESKDDTVEESDKNDFNEKISEPTGSEESEDTAENEEVEENEETTIESQNGNSNINDSGDNTTINENIVESKVEVEKETEKENETTIEKETNNVEETLNGFTGTQTESTDASNQTSDEGSESEESETTTESSESEETTTVEKENEESEESETKTESSENEETTTIENKESEESKESETTTESSEKEETTTENEETLVATNISSYSEIIYGDEVVEYETKVDSISMAKGFEMATGLVDDKKKVIPDRNYDPTDILNAISQNSIKNAAYMENSIENVEESLKSAYVILEFKAGQTEKLIELTIKNDNKYRGERQAHFNLSPVDDSLVAGNYAKITLLIKDDEPEELPKINFTKTNYYPNDGYIEVEVERTGEMSSIATCMIDSYDDTAKSSRDYSQVHAELLFGLGIEKRSFKIPIVSSFIDDKATFTLKLQEAKGAEIGDKGTATCTIKSTDKNFKYAEEKLKMLQDETNSELFGSGNGELGLSDDTLFGAAGDDIQLSTIVVGPELNLQKDCVSWLHGKERQSSWKYDNGGKSFNLHLAFLFPFPWEDSHQRYHIILRPAKEGFKYSIAGFQIKWSANNKGNNYTVVKELKPYNLFPLEISTIYENTYSNRNKWLNREDNFFFTDAESGVIKLEFERYGDLIRGATDWNIDYIKPIYKMFKIVNQATIIPSDFIDGDGNRGLNDKQASYAVTQLENATTDGTAISYAGQEVKVKLKDSQNNDLFYIKSLYITNADGSIKHKIVDASENDIKTGEIGFRIDEKFLEKYNSVIKQVTRAADAPHDGQNVGLNGQIYVQAELGTKTAYVEVEKDDRVDVKIWGSSGQSSGTSNNYEFKVGDILHFTADVKPEYQEQYTCDGITISRILPPPDPNTDSDVTIRRSSDGSSFFPYDTKVTKVRAKAELSDKNNVVKVRVKTSDIRHFDRSYGLFSKYTGALAGNWTEYVIESDFKKVYGRYFDVKARCRSNSEAPVWYVEKRQSEKYMQEEFFFQGASSASENIIYLTYDKPDSKNYSLQGKAYYVDAPLDSNTVEGEPWQHSEGVGVLVDDRHYAYTSSDGAYTVMPGQGKVGYYKRIKIVSNGVDQYENIAIKQDKLQDDHYVINVKNIIVGNTTSIHPHLSGINVGSWKLNDLLLIFRKYAWYRASDAVYINNDKETTLTARVKNTKLDGSPYTYTYTDADGNERTQIENVKRVEFLVVDARNHNIKTILKATNSNADKTEWTINYKFKKGRYNEYQSGDKLYARVVTDRKVGDGMGDVTVRQPDGEMVTERVEIPQFQETIYQAISSRYLFREQAEKQPVKVTLKMPENETPMALPIIGDLTMMVDLGGLTLGVSNIGDRKRLYVGATIKNIGNQFDESGKFINRDTGAVADEKDVGKQLSALMTRLKGVDDDDLYKMDDVKLGQPVWSVKPSGGAYFEFMYTESGGDAHQEHFRFIGGGLFVGAVANLKLTQTFLLGVVPAYVGVSFTLDLFGEVGVAYQTDVHFDENADQTYFDNMTRNSTVEGLIRAKFDVQGYAGIGLCNVLGVRGGVNLIFTFILDSTNAMKIKYGSNFRNYGLSIVGGIKFWIDAILFSYPIPAWGFWDKPLNFGYFEDMENYKKKYKKNASSSLYGVDGDDSRTMGAFNEKELKPRPRFSGNSTFVANSNNTEGLFGGTYAPIDEDLIEGVYDAAEPKLMRYDDTKGLLVYLDDDSGRSDYDRTVLRYILYDTSNNSWSTPQDVWSGNATADFSPNLCDCGDKILLSWNSRPNVLPDNFDKRVALNTMEIYTCFFDKATGQFVDEDGDGNVDIVRMTNDNLFDYYPKAEYDEEEDAVHLYYLKTATVSEINNGDDLLDNVQPEVNGAYLMYMTYADIGDGQGKRWLTDYYYDFELPNSLPAVERQAFINEWKGQRFKNLSTDVGGGGINNPNISDYELSYAEMFDIATDEVADAYIELFNDMPDFESLPEDEIDAAIADFEQRLSDLNNYYSSYRKKFNITSYVVDQDGDATTENDTDIYLKLQCATESEARTVRITNNNVPDTRPKMVRTDEDTYLFWIQNGSMIKMTNLNDIITRAFIEDQVNDELVTNMTDIFTTDKLFMGDKINNIIPFADSDDNVYLIWQQQSDKNPSTVDEDGEIHFSQDLYIAGLVKIDDQGGNDCYNWSYAINLTDNDRVDDLPAVAMMGSDYLVLVNNSYYLKSKTADKDSSASESTYEISDSKLKAVYYMPKSSMQMVDINNVVKTTNADGSILYETTIDVANTGLYTAEGCDYTAKILYDNQVLTTFNGGSEDYIYPRDTVSIKGEFTLTEEQQENLDKVKIQTEFIERNVGPSVHGDLEEKNVFKTKEEFKFVVYDNESTDDLESTSEVLTVEQQDDNFVVKGVLINNGNIPTRGNEKIYVYDNNDWDNPIASSDYFELPVNQQIPFSITLSSDQIKDMYYGLKNLMVCVKNDSGALLSHTHVVQIDAREPFDFKVNGSKDTVRLKVGETLTLKTTYRPNDRYEDGTALYLVGDTDIAKNDGNKLYGVKEGTTTMWIKTKEFGGNHKVTVIVDPYSGGGGSGGSGGGGGGGGPVLPSDQVINTTTTELIKTNPIILDTKTNSVTWMYDPVNDKFKLNVSVNGQSTSAINGFYTINDVVMQNANGLMVETNISRTYFFDKNGYMITGWLNTADNKWYFFENMKNIDEGSMVIGWRKIKDTWYYFVADGSMLTNSITPDGYYVGADGAWIAPVLNATQNN